MPKDSSIKKVFVIGSGPIVIGQACEFDYSGTQAIKALKEEGVEVVLLNSNPATVMTDPEFAARTYVEPMTVEVAKRIIALERPDSLLPTMGGQTALNLAKALAEEGILDKYGVRLIGASLEAINKAEDRQLFKAAMEKIGVPMPKSGYASTLEEALSFISEIGFPAIIRPSFTLGGTGGGIAYNRDEFVALCTGGLEASPNSSILVEESVLGWKEFELEVVRDKADNVIIVCSIENLDPMGVHTGDSITVAPQQTLTDKEYQQLRDASVAIMREIGVDTGGSNVQFGVNPADGRIVVIEMNPRVSRSSALASKATGYPIAKIAAKLALGYTLDELKNDITRDTPASFEPALDYVVVKVPRFTFEKFPNASRTLSTQMRSVGEVMAIGRTFREAYMKAMRSMDQGRLPLASPAWDSDSEQDASALAKGLAIPTPERPYYVAEAFRRGMSVAEVHALCKIDPWFLAHLQASVSLEARVKAVGTVESVDYTLMREAKRDGFSDLQMAALLRATEDEVRARRHALKLRPVYKRVDTCAAEFEAYTPYLYSTYEQEDEAPPTDRKKVMILGSGPIRIGQGIEFDYACVHAAFALRDAGYETVMVNCNPETVSTDYDTSDRLYFEPLTLEDVLEIADREKPLGVIIQFGGQTPLRLSKALEKNGLKVLGTSPDAIDRAEDRERFSEVLLKLGLLAPEHGVARSADEALEVAARIGFPVMVRPSYVLGGRAMECVYDAGDLARYMREAVIASPEHPVLVDRFLRSAVEVDVDAVRDTAGRVLIGGVLEHVEEAGVHSGDAACTLPPYSLPADVVETMKDQLTALANELGVVGLINAQFAVQGRAVYVLEVNPRASRTVPFISKATGVPLAKLAARVSLGETLEQIGVTHIDEPKFYSVKESVFPFAKFSGTDAILGPEMRSTGEVMGMADDVETAFLKSQMAAGAGFPRSGRVLLSLHPSDKPGGVDIARRLVKLGYVVAATTGTHCYLAEKGIPTELCAKVNEGRPDVVDRLLTGEFGVVVVTSGPRPKESFPLRRGALTRGVPLYTTMQSARMMIASLEAMHRAPVSVTSLQARLNVGGEP